MPRYEYRCTVCGAEMEIMHRMSETVEHRAHEHPETQEVCDGLLERLISMVGVAKEVGHKAPSDQQIEKAGFTKYVRGSRGYEKAAGPTNTPNYIQREPDGL